MKTNPIESLRDEASQDKKDYDVRFCKCGTIHFIEENIVTDTIESNKELIVICGGCGNSFIIGADRELDWNDPESGKYVYNMYSHDLNQSFITTKEEDYVIQDNITGHVFSANPIIRYSIGKRIMLMNGNYADTYFNNSFSDSSYPGFLMSFIDRHSTTMEEIREYVSDWNVNRSSVNMRWVLNNLNDDELRNLSKYSFECFEWSGTKYETKYNKK